MPPASVELGGLRPAPDTVLQIETTILHAGFPKTGTTALQHGFFNSLAGCAYVGPSAPTLNVFAPLANNLAGAEDPDYLEGALGGLLDDARGDEETLIVSWEKFSRRRSGGRTSRRLHRLLPDALVVLCVRDQRTMVHSMYHQYLKHGGRATMADWAEGELEPEHLEFDIAVGDYQQEFGPERVRVLRYEDLRDDPPAFLAELRALIGFVDRAPTSPLPTKNRSLSPRGGTLLRQVNRLYRARRYAPDGPRGDHTAVSRHDAVFSWVRRIDGRLPGSPGVPTQEAFVRLEPRWAESNARLEAMTGIDLAGAGYPVAR